MNNLILKVVNIFSRFLPPKEQAIAAAAVEIAEEVKQAKAEKKKKKKEKANDST